MIIHVQPQDQQKCESTQALVLFGRHFIAQGGLNTGPSGRGGKYTMLRSVRLPF